MCGNGKQAKIEIKICCFKKKIENKNENKYPTAELCQLVRSSGPATVGLLEKQYFFFLSVFQVKNNI